MPDFNPDQFLKETTPLPAFDPDKFLSETAPTQPQQENPHDNVPFLKTLGKSLLTQGKDVVSGATNAVMNPSQTLSDIGNSLDSSDSDYAQGLYRAVRSIPVAGDAIDNIVGSSKALYGDITGNPEQGDKALNDYNQSIQQSDVQHAKEHPLTDFIQRSAGLAGLAGPIAEQSGVLAIDAFSRSLKAGNNVSDALKDAAHTALLSALAIKGGHLASDQLAGLPGKLGVSDDAMAAYKANPEMMNQAIDTVKNPSSVPNLETPDMGEIANQQSPIPNFPTKDQLSSSLHPEDFGSQVGPSQADLDLAKQFTAGNNQGQTFSDLGKYAGGALGSGLGSQVFGVEGAVGGGFIGSKLGKGVGSLIDTYGAPAVKTAMDAGIQLDKVANTPYIGALMKAAAEGPKSLAVTHYLLNQTDSDYQKAVNGQ